MGFLRKKFKQVKNAVKKVGKAVKKVVKKVTKSKLFKTIATIGAVLATGGAAIGAFGGSFASTGLGKAIINSGKFFGKFNPTGFKPFASAGKFIGSTLGKVTDFTGLTSEATRLAPSTESIVSEAAAKTVEASSTSKLAKGTILGDVTRSVGTSVGTGVIMQQIQGDPDKVGVATGLNVEADTQLGDLAVAYSDAGVTNLDNIYKMNYYGTADVGFNANEPLFQQETLAIT